MTIIDWKSFLREIQISRKLDFLQEKWSAEQKIPEKFGNLKYMKHENRIDNNQDRGKPRDF